MRSLLVAAGGGGDVVGAILARRCIASTMEDPLAIATYAWERVRVDPYPGPRPPKGFSGLALVGDKQVEVLPNSDTVPKGRSMLPRLVSSSNARIFVLDADDGAIGIHSQIDHLVKELGIDRVVIVDVGGDLIAQGTERELLSPLADSLILAACLDLSVPVDVCVVGPGADGELAEWTVLAYLTKLNAIRVGEITPADVYQLTDVLQWHPTEATGIVAAAALGTRGTVELRRKSISTIITDHSAEVWVADIATIAEHNCLVFPLAETISLSAAEVALEQWATSELTRERQRSRDYCYATKARNVESGQFLSNVMSYSQEAQQRGIDFITGRRLAEAVEYPELEISQLNALLEPCLPQQNSPLWSVKQLARIEI